NEGVEPTNNAAERALRCAVQWRKTSFGSRSVQGEIAVARLLTATRTCRMQNREPLDYLGTAKVYPDALRRIRYVDAETKKRLTFLTNNFALPALTIALIYKCRWQVELFFKWIKQHLRIKAFFGTSENAVKTQIWIALSAYVLIRR